MGNKNYAGAWRQKARARAERPKVTPLVQVDLGDGCEFIGRRLDLAGWFKGGRVPQRLTEQLIRIGKGEQAETVQQDMTADEIIFANQWTRETICICVAEPQIILDETVKLQDEQVRFSEIFGEYPEWIDKITAWIVAGCPGVPVALENGEVTTIEALETFREVEPGLEHVGAGVDVQELRETAERDSAIG